MNIKSKFNDKEIALLEELNIEIKADYNNEELQNLENSVYNAMMDNLDEKQDFTPRAEEIEHILDIIVEIENNWGNEEISSLGEQGTTNDLAIEYSNLADKFIKFEDETEN